MIRGIAFVYAHRQRAAADLPVVQPEPLGKSTKAGAPAAPKPPTHELRIRRTSTGAFHKATCFVNGGAVWWTMMEAKVKTRQCPPTGD